METAHALLERAKRPLAVVALAGVVALGGAGCSMGGESPAPEASHAPAVSYEVSPEADKLPTLSSYEHVITPPSADSYVDSGMLAVRADKFDWYSNINPDKNAPRTEENSLPNSQSAAVLDVMIDKSGELRFKNYQEDSTEMNTLLGVVADSADVAKATLKKGDVHLIHFRVFKPNQYPSNPDWEPETTMQYIPHDYNDNGNPAAYVYLAAPGRDNTEIVSKVLKHELIHGELGELGSNIAKPSPEQVQAFTEACTTMRKAAAKHMQQDGEAIVQSLQDLRGMVPKKYASAFTKVAQAIQNGTYDQLQEPKEDQDAIPACFLRNPEQAVYDYVKELSGGGIPEEMHDDYFVKESVDMVEDWQDLTKETAVYRALSESTYLPSERANKVWGHPHEGYFELAVGTGNAVMDVPVELAQHVIELPADQRDAVCIVVGEDYKVLKARYSDDLEYSKIIDKQFKQFADKVGIVLAPL
ncbi:MAG TPA: hypothetical protein VLI54_02205 [Bacillota bacterium]|nr:hypothetical protein [Bacillota bacterium]